MLRTSIVWIFWHYKPLLRVKHVVNHQVVFGNDGDAGGRSGAESLTKDAPRETLADANPANWESPKKFL
jgi:hypothetical protein